MVPKAAACISLDLSSGVERLYFGKLAKSGEQISLLIDSNFTPGYWEIKAQAEDIEKSRIFYVEELQKISSTLNEGILTIINVGNVPYKKQIEISIGGKSEIRKLDLDIGESKQFKLGAPDGEYDINVNDGETTHSLGSTFLTGKVVSIGEGGGLSFGNLNVWLWTLVIVILLVIVVILIRKIVKRRYIGKIPKNVTPVIGKVGQLSPMYQTKDNSLPAIGNVMERGEKQDASIVALKIKNLPELQKMSGDNSLAAVDKALLKAKAVKTKIYVDKDYRLILFIPTITKDKDNDTTAIDVAKDIETILNEYNKTSANKIEFGIGVHYGQMGIESQNGNVKFVSLDNTIAIAKRVADGSNNNILLSEQIHRRTFGKIKVEKVEGTNFWQLNRLMNRANYEDFINRFLNRQKKT